MIYLLIVFAAFCVVGCFAAWLKMVKQDGQQFTNIAETQTEKFKKAN
ncbi:hypothetical protein SFC66_14145 [Terribacillus saccharophilus]